MTTSFIDVPTWHGWWKALEDLLFLFFIHFIGRECLWFFTGFGRPPFSILCSFWECLGCHYLVMCSCNNRKSFFKAWCSSKFFAHLLSWLAWFLLSGLLLIVCFALSNFLWTSVLGSSPLCVLHFRMLCGLQSFLLFPCPLLFVYLFNFPLRAGCLVKWSLPRFHHLFLEERSLNDHHLDTSKTTPTFTKPRSTTKWTKK